MCEKCRICPLDAGSAAQRRGRGLHTCRLTSTGRVRTPHAYIQSRSGPPHLLQGAPYRCFSFFWGMYKMGSTPGYSGQKGVPCVTGRRETTQRPQTTTKPHHNTSDRRERCAGTFPNPFFRAEGGRTAQARPQKYDVGQTTPFCPRTAWDTPISRKRLCPTPFCPTYHPILSTSGGWRGEAGR